MTHYLRFLYRQSLNLLGVFGNFEHNIHTRIIEKDHFVPTIPTINGNQQYYLSGPSMCIGGNEKDCFGSKIQ